MTEPAQVVSFRMAPDVLTALRDIANEQGCTVSDLMRRGALMALEEPNRMVITWTSPPVVSLEPATEDASGPAEPGEGGGTGAGEREAHGGAQGAMDPSEFTATIEHHERQIRALGSEWQPLTGGILRNPIRIGEEDPPALVLPTVDAEWREGVQAVLKSFQDAANRIAVNRFTTALLTGLDDLERDDHWGTLVRPGDVADLVHRVAAEVGR